MSNNQASFDGGAISNMTQSSVYLTNTTGTGNLVLSSGPNGHGGFTKNNGGIFQGVNSVLAYNYYSEDFGINFELDDFNTINSLSGLKIYYSLYHGGINGGIGADVQNIQYEGMEDGSDNSIFSGGLLSKADSLGFERGSGVLFRPYLWEEDGTVYTPLKFGSELLKPASAGTATRFGLANVVNCTGFSTSEFTRNGSGTIVNSNTVRLTQARGGQSGSVWANDKVDLREDFSVEVEIYLGTTDRFGADGIAFVFQPLSVNAGSSGGGLGYAGINPSLAIEYDTWKNSADPTPSDHSSIMLNGNTGRHAQVVPFSSLGNIEDGKWHSVKITWEAATKKFTHVFDGKQLFSINYDIVGNIFSGNPYVYWGFTAATGGAVNLQQVRFSEICSVSENPSPAIAYYDGYNFQNVTGASQPGQEVDIDQTGNEKMDPPVRGAVEKIVKDLVSLKVVADPDSNSVLGTSIGGSVFGEVFPKGTRKIVTAVPNDQNSIRFESWNNVSLPDPARVASESTTTSNVNPYDEFIDINTIIFPKFAAC